ncbi:MAG: protein-disulfide reductase DsbD [Pseudomonadales bacterium]|nr:protein-disulfide reductase DsbD [Pseudomonadales bacterium]NIX09711.1 protein-disulfide reductase DsbD [Pseudomonadales bacterium]
MGFVLLLAVCGAAAAELDNASAGASAWLSEQPTFLPVDDAFAMSAEVAPDGAVLVRWDIAEGYYLYRHRFSFETRALEEGQASAVLGAAEIPPGEAKVDEYFGAVEVYYGRASARVPVQGGGTLEVGIGYQGCADLGLCYPPETRWVTLTLPGAPQVASGGDAGGPSGGSPVAVQTEERVLASLLAEGSLLTALLLFFAAGLGLTFTPCVLPMVPILSSIIIGDSKQLTRSRGISLSLAYVLGMAVTYAIIGTLVGLFGASLNVQAALQSPPVLVGFALVFAALSLSMFGLYELRLPASWQSAVDSLGSRTGGGKHVSVAVMGSLSSLVVSPCVSAPLAGALIYLSATGDAVLGGGALLALGLGMGVPLLVIGASGGQLLPRAGEWMNGVKVIFGVLLLAVAVWLLERVVPGPVNLALWAVLAIGAGAYLGLRAWGGGGMASGVVRSTGLISFVYGALLLAGAVSGGNDPLRPLAGLIGDDAAHQAGELLDWHPVDDVVGLQAAVLAASRQGKPVMIDLYADWCISCKVMERNVFPKPEVAARLAQFHLVRADVTANHEHHKALLDELGVFGPPSMVFFAEDGRKLTEVTVQGEIGAEALAAHLGVVLGRVGPDNFSEIARNFL